MEYRFRAKKSWNIPRKVMGIIWLGLIISNFFPRNVDEYRWIILSLIFLGFIFIGLCFRALSQKIILTITDSGISYSCNDYIFAPKLENIAAERLSKILIPDYEPIDFNEGWLKPRVCLLDQQGKLIRDLDRKQWQPLDDLDLEQALKTCLKDKIELANRSKMLEMVNKHQQEVVNPDVGKVAGYFAYSSVGLVLICIALAFLDTNITIAWGQYEYLIWGIALTVAVISLVFLVRSKTHILALVFVPFVFTAVMTFCIHQSLLLLNYYLGEQKSYRFEKVIQNKDYEMWRTATGETVECISSPRKLHDYKTGNVRIGVLGVVRTRFNEVCMSPQEIKRLTTKHT